MIDKRFRLPIIDFMERAHEIPHLIGVVLFGSGIKGDVSKKSDIDLLMVFSCDHNPEVGEEAIIARRIATEISVKHDLRYPFSFTFVNLNQMKDVDPDFLWSVAHEGMLIWGEPNGIIARSPHPSLQPLMMIRYETKGMDMREKRTFLRALYTNKNSILDKDEERIAPGTILLGAEKLDIVRDLLDRFHVRYSMKRMWSY